MKVKEFYKKLNLDDCGVVKISMNIVENNKIHSRILNEVFLDYAEYDRYDTVTEWFLAEYGEYDILDDAYLSGGCFYCDLARWDDETMGKSH